ncbi:MAG: hypothetical protein QF544_02900 [Candidatus Thalassarchaeaceae archaeon]|nr:hypothetical protein [Candidatus Thalassarchaeaceae archaeon]
MAQSRRLPSIMLATLMLFSTIAVHLAISDTQNLTPTGPISESGPNSMEVLILGNSYTQGNNLDSLTESLLQNDVANANADRLAAGGLNLDDHANRAQTAGHQWNTTLNSGNWDWVVLQDQSQIPSFPTSGSYWQNSKAGAAVLNEIIKDNGGETVFLMTWGRRNGDQDNLWRNPDYLTMQANLESGYRLYAENITTPTRPVWIAPAGLAFKHIYDDIAASGVTPENSGTLFHDLYTSDGSHPSLSGSYLSSCVIYATITGSNPVGLSGPSGLSSSRILELQEAAAATVFNETQNLVYPWHNFPSTTFAYGNTSVVLHPALNETTALTHRPGKRVDNATMNLTAEGMREWSNNSNSMIQLSPNSTFSDATVDANGNLRLNGSVLGGSPNAGTNNTQITQAVQWQAGNYSFDTFRLACVSGSCGSISVVGGPLHISANTIIIDYGASILAEELVWGNAGQGNSTARASNGKSPGAGGGGHGGFGGAGGGTNGGVGGHNYGNGSEPGSSGGNVTHTSSGQLSNDANGGRGGGVIELGARNIIINGTISVNGGRGDDGAPPASGTGAGGSGAGGGSGGSIYAIANSVYIGHNAMLSANGGNGGDGAPGAQSGIGIGMHDGGNGGGGGAGGMVLVAAMPGQITNNGAMQANGGSGGARGAPYGSGVYGTAGNNGYNGYAFTGTFSGLTGITAYHYNGNFTSPIFGQQGILQLNSTVAVPNNQPVNTSIVGTYHYSIDGTVWSPWIPFNLSGESMPPFALIQFRLWLSTTNNSTTPTASSINLNMSNWQSIDDFDLSISQTPRLNPIITFSQELGVVRSSTATYSQFGGTATFHMYIPTNATPIDTAWFHLSPPQFSSHGNVQISLGGKNILTINSSNIPEMGITIEINKTHLEAQWPTSPSTNNGIGGIAWSDLPITVSTSLGYMGSFSNPLMVLPYRLTQTLGSNGSIVNALNNYVSQNAGSWSFATFSTFPVICSGGALDTHSILLDALMVNFIDDIPPVVTNISFYVDGQEVSEARIGDMVEIRVRVFGNESDATVEWNFQGLGGISSWPPSSLSSMTWDTLHNSYHGYYDTSQHSSEYGDSMALWLWLTDAEGNLHSPSGVGAWYTFLVLKPVYPEFKTLEVSGCSDVVVIICNAEAETEIEFQAAAVGDRSDFAAFTHVVNPSNTSEDFVIPLFWNESSNMYEGSTSFTPAELGWWDIMFRFIDVNRAEDVWSNASISKLHLIDETAPVEGTLVVEMDQSEPSSWSINGEWLATIADNSSASISVNGPNNYEASIPLSTSIVNDSMNVTSYVALGSTETMGYGASSSENTVTGLIHGQLNQTWSDVTLTNISDSWGTVQNFISKEYEIFYANPDIITIIPLRDYISSSTSVWRLNYPILLDDLASTGAQIYIGVLQLDPDYVCHIASGPGGCHSFGEYEMVIEKTEIITEIASTRPWVTLVPLSDDGPEHPEWRDSNDDFTDAGHASLAASFLHMIEGDSSMRTVNYEGRNLLDTSNLAPGTYEFEMEVVDEAGNVALDAMAGVDATQFIAPANGILELSILTTAPSVLHPGDFEIDYNAECIIGCTMLLQVSIDGEIVQTLQPTSGANSIKVSIPSIGTHTVSMTLSTPDWNVSFITDSLEIYATPAPAPEWHIACTYHEEEVTQYGVAYKGEIGNLTTSAHYIECSLTNSGEVSGIVQVSPNAITDPFDCTSSALAVSPDDRALFYCTAEESDETTGIHQLSIAFEEVNDTVNNSIGGWDTTSVLVSPRFETVGQEDGDDSNQMDDGSTDVSSKSPITWLMSAIILLLIGIGGISMMFAMRDRKEATIGVVNVDSLFKDDASLDSELSTSETLHPSITEQQETNYQEDLQSDGVKWE